MPRRSKALCWTGVGVVMSVKPSRPEPVGAIRLAAIVARFESRVAKLWTGRCSGVSFLAAFLSAEGAFGR